MKVQKDNTTKSRKAMLRLKALQCLDESPVVLETHGGWGKLYGLCYHGVAQGAVCEKLPEKVAALADQRPSWAVYEGDCEQLLRAGAASHLTVNLLDLDPYGSPWSVLDAFLGSERPWAERLVVVVNDGMRQGLQRGRAWDIDVLAEAVARWGNDLHPIYLEVCEELLGERAGHAGYDVTRFGGYYCGHNQNMTHYLAVLQRRAS